MHAHCDGDELLSTLESLAEEAQARFGTTVVGLHIDAEGSTVTLRLHREQPASDSTLG